MIRIRSYLAAAAAILLACPGAVCAAGLPDDVLVENAKVKLTRGDYEADLQRVPSDMRDAFASDPGRLTKMLNNILIDKTLAAEARQAGVDREPLVARVVALETDRILAQLQLQRLDAAAGAEFDAKQADFLLKARETYAVGKDKYRAPEEVKASHILFETRKSAPEAALVRANEARAKLLAGADFAALAKEISDDPSAKINDGELGWFGAAKLDPEFTKAAFALKNVGDISEPVRSSFGYHLIRFEGRRAPRQLTFDEVKDSIMADLRARYISDQHQAKLASIRSDPTMKINQTAVDGLVYQVDPEIFRRALPQQPTK
jgi:peptidyl-prolyl cis-trans isomerase C